MQIKNVSIMILKIKLKSEKNSLEFNQAGV